MLIPTDIVEIVRSGDSTDKELQTKSIEDLDLLAKQRKNIMKLIEIIRTCTLFLFIAFFVTKIINVWYTVHTGTQIIVNWQ